MQAESRAVARLDKSIDDAFCNVVQLILATRGRVVVSGLGKSGLIGAKLAATLASTGTPAFFVHAGDALHGDAGAVIGDDLALMLSHSGSTVEVIEVAKIWARRGAITVAITAQVASPLARAAHAHLDTRVDREAGPFGLAPTSSTTATLALGDALAAAVQVERGFTSEDFASNHPAGNLGGSLEASKGDG